MEVPGGGAHWAIFRTPDVRQEVTKALLLHAEARRFVFLSFHTKRMLKWNLNEFNTSIRLCCLCSLIANLFTSCDYNYDIA